MNKRITALLFVSICIVSHPLFTFFKDPLANAFECKQMFFTPSIQKIIGTLKIKLSEKKNLPCFTTDRPLLNAYPQLKTTLPWISLANLPTPITRLENIQKVTGAQHVYLKNDGLTSQPVGGNKVRKLELLFADALTQGATYVMTFGCAGSNHAAATAFHAKKLGLKCALFLKNQPNSAIVQNNLLIDANSQAKIFFYPSEELRKLGATNYFLHRFQEDEMPPYVIFTGGSSALGAIGYVNAAFELKEQISQGLIPEPHSLYVPAGSLGTVAGLIVGLRACGLSTRVIAVAVESAEYRESCLKLVQATTQLLHELAPSFPLFTFTHNDLSFEMQFAGPGYGVVTPEAAIAMEIFASTEIVRLEGTYTGKAAAALLHDLATCQELHNEVILFWNTFGIEELAVQPDAYAILPKPLQTYFSEQSKVLS